MSMRMSLLAGTSLALIAGLFATEAKAQFYLGAEGGWTSLDSSTDQVGAVSVKRNYSDGFNVGARAGYQWGPWRVEEEYSYRDNGNGRGQVGPAGVNFGGSRTSNAIMTNAIYDFNVGWPVTPHLGAGIGAVEINDSLSVPGLGKIANSSDWEFGYQAIAGVRYDINPNWAFDLDYRYLATTDPTFRTSLGGVKYRSGYSTQNLLASITYKFGAAPPPVVESAAPPAPPPAVPHQVFLVFFDWDQDKITPAGMQIVQQAATAYKTGGSVHLIVTGYTDRSGSAGYNQRLSERRANNVANTMAQLGVSRGDMAVSGRGENDNRVPTANGVREPQNRRVEISS